MEWISVENKLPREDDEWIVCLINGHPVLGRVGNATVYIGDHIYFYFPTNKWIKNSLYGDITHWTPLPEKPEGQN